MTEERLVRAVKVLAEIVRAHGPAYGPLHDSLAQELDELRKLHQDVGGASEPALVTKTDKAA